MSEADNSLIFDLAAHFAKRNTRFGGSGKRRRSKQTASEMMKVASGRIC